MEKAVTALFNQLLLLFSIMQGINAEPLTFLPFLPFISYNCLSICLVRNLADYKKIQTFCFFCRISRMNRKAILLIGLLTDFRGYLAAGQWLAPEMGSYCFCHADFADDANFFSLIILVPQISQIYTDFFSLIIFLMDLHGFSLIFFFSPDISPFSCHFFFFSVISLFRRF